MLTFFSVALVEYANTRRGRFLICVYRLATERNHHIWSSHFSKDPLSNLVTPPLAGMNYILGIQRVFPRVGREKQVTILNIFSCITISIR